MENHRLIFLIISPRYNWSLQIRKLTNNSSFFHFIQRCFLVSEEEGDDNFFCCYSAFFICVCVFSFKIWLYWEDNRNDNNKHHLNINNNSCQSYSKPKMKMKIVENVYFILTTTYLKVSRGKEKLNYSKIVQGEYYILCQKWKVPQYDTLHQQKYFFIKMLKRQNILELLTYWWDFPYMTVVW